MVAAARAVFLGAACGLAVARAQDVIVTAPAWTAPNDPPDVLPGRKRTPAIEFPAELKRSPDIGYAIFDLVIDAKGKVLANWVHATLEAYERAARGYSGDFGWAPGRREGKAVNSEATFAVIFNPASAAEKKPEATPRLLEVTPVRVRPAKRGEASPGGVALADVSVDESGLVTAVKNAPPGLERDFAVAARNWRFAPARRGGAAVAAEVRVPFVVVPLDPESVASGGKNVPPRATHQEPPIYPREMRESGMRGEVIVDFLVDIEGRVRNAHAVRSLNPAFDDPAVEAVRRWRFEPGLKGDRPVVTHMQVPVVFQLDETHGGGQGPLTETRRGDLSKLPEQFRYDTPPKPTGTVRVVYPYGLLRAQKKGKASVAYVIGAKGGVVQAEVREASVPEFGRAVQAAVECFTYQPALKGGRPGLALQGFSQEFGRDYLLQLVSAEDLSLLRREEKAPEGILSVRDLDAPPAPLSRRPPRFPLSVPESTTKGEAVIEFIIDEEGRARLPRILSSSHEAFGYAAVQAVATWRFEPPKRGGRAVAVRVGIPFNFGEEPAAK